MNIEHFRVDTLDTHTPNVTKEKPPFAATESDVLVHLFDGLTQQQRTDTQALLSQLGKGENDARIPFLSPEGIGAVRAYASAPAFSADRKALMPKIKDAFSHAETVYLNSLD